LGIFDSVDLRYDRVDEDTRDVVFTVDEGKRLNFSLLAGYGSYEQLRGGFELEQFNIMGLGHSSRLKAIQSFKSSSVDLHLYHAGIAGGRL
jgi:outer membrane protein assembly factor BamA